MAITLQLCDACECGWLTGGDEPTQGLVDHYLDTLAMPDTGRRETYDRIGEAHARLGLKERGLRVELLLSHRN
jgi:hypothetical protein